MIVSPEGSDSPEYNQSAEVPPEESTEEGEAESGYTTMDQLEPIPEGSEIDFTQLSLVPIDFIRSPIKKLNDEYKAIVYRFNDGVFQKREKSQKDISLDKKHTLVNSDYFDSNAPVREALTSKTDKALSTYSDLKKKSPSEDSESLMLKAAIDNDLSDKEFEDLTKYSNKGNKYSGKVNYR